VSAVNTVLILLTLPSTPLMPTFVVAVCSVLLPESCVFPHPVFLHVTSFSCVRISVALAVP